MALTQISTGGVKDDAVTAGKIPANAVGSSEIADDAVGADQIAAGAVVNAGVDASAAIAGTKVSPAFGSQNISTTGTLASGAATVTGNINATSATTCNSAFASTNNSTRSTIELNGKDSSGNEVELRLGGFGDTNRGEIFTVTNHAIGFATNNAAPQMILSTSGNLDVSGGTVSDSKGDLRLIPENVKSSAYTLIASDEGKHINISSGGVTIPNSVFREGSAVTIINSSGSDQTITQGSGVTLYNSADASTGNRTLAGRGMCTILFVSASVGYISGAGLS